MMHVQDDARLNTGRWCREENSGWRDVEGPGERIRVRWRNVRWGHRRVYESQDATSACTIFFLSKVTHLSHSLSRY